MAEDFNRLRMLSKKLVATNFQKDWLFRLEVEGEPADFDLYIKDISYTPIEITTDEENYGGVTMAWPTGRVPVKITATMRDDEDRRNSRFFYEWCEKAVHADGTVGLPYEADGYVKKVRVYEQRDDGTETLAGEWEMYATSPGETSRSRENGSYKEFPVALVQFTTGSSPILL